MDYQAYKLRYELYLQSTARNQSDIIKYTAECACLEAGDITGIQIMNESAIDSLKNAIQKIIAAISGIWKKFIERANEIISTDTSYLEKYKDIICNKPPKSKDITMYQYKLDNLNLAVPQFNYDDTMKKWLSSDDAKKNFMSTFLGSAKLNENLDVKEAIEEFVRGDNQADLDGKNLNMKEMYNFCINYKATVAQIQKDTDTIMKSKGIVDKLIGQLGMKFKDVPDKKVTQSSNSSTQPAVTGGDMAKAAGTTTGTPKQVETNDDGTLKSKVESSIYSNVYGKYLTEADKQTIGATKDTDTKSGSSTDASTKGAQVDSSVNKGIVNKDNAAKVSNIGNDNNINEQGKAEFKALEDNSPAFFECCGHMLAAKLTLSQEIHKNYMAIIRAHVRDYIGETK